MDSDIVVRFTPDGRAPRRDAAAFIGITPKTLAEWKRLGKGPMPRRVGSRIFYFRRDIEAFIATGAREAEK